MLAALLTLSVAVTPARADQNAVAVLFDRDLTVGAGATVTAAVGDAVARAEEAIVPVRLFSDHGVAKRAVNVTYRVVKLLFFDIPQEQWLIVANHEVMGHGARLRERFDGSIRYSIDAPAPYGRGGGTTFFQFDRQPTAAELLAVAAAGMEADAVAARIAAERAFARGHMRPRDAIRYLGFELDTLTYVLSTGDDLDDEARGHDVAQFLRTYNEIARDAGTRPLTARAVRREVLASLANPMVGLAAYGLGRYLWNGATDVRVPALSIGGVRYLPLVRYQLAPYGTEYAVANHLSGARWPTRIDVRVGRAPGARPWGVGVERREIATWRSWRLDAGVDVFRQPGIAGRTEPALQRTRVGFDVRGRAEREFFPVFFSEQRATVIIDVGAKTSGFVPGEPLGGGLVARVGMGFPLK